MRGKKTKKTRRVIRRRKARMGPALRRILYLTALALVASSMILGLAYTLFLDIKIRQQFEGRRWALPARVFARPLEVYNNSSISADTLVEELKLLRYHRDYRVDEPGEFIRKADTVTLHTRGFPFWDGEEPERLLRIVFRDAVVSSVIDKISGMDLGLLRLEPVPIASIYPVHNEDRMLVRREDVPKLLITALLTVEDRHFYQHHGLDISAVARAALANLKAGRTVQGGSTLTQQLVKNYFLSNERTLWRKLNEAVMAWLLEWHYSKDEILEAYLNEVYLGQDGKRAIHGFGLASQFYFERRLQDLKLDQIATLVALIKGPSYYDPRRYPQRAKSRRNLVLELLAQHGEISSEQLARLKAKNLGISSKAPPGVTPFPAFLQLVREQLKRDYRDQDLRAEGLMIFTTMDPIVQLRTEHAMTTKLARLEKRRHTSTSKLQGATVVSDVENGEVLAVVGDRNPRFAGYNRALDTRRSIGSLIKPVVFLSALSHPNQYTLATQLEDMPFSIRMRGGQVWSPNNHDHQSHGSVLLRDALVHSYNLSTARLGLAVGLGEVTDHLHRLGLRRNVAGYPSMLLGAVEMSPLEVSQLYQTLAAGGYQIPLKAIREVMDRDGVPLQRYPLSLERTVDPAAVYLVNAILYEVTQQGTARGLQALLPEGLEVAGKTGTTNDQRDSWFAGFSGEHLIVVWIGRDDNRSTGLSGASGAMSIWADIMSSIATRSLDMIKPANVEWVLIDPTSGLMADTHCNGAEWVPFINGTAPVVSASCSRGGEGEVNGAFKWLSEVFK